MQGLAPSFITALERHVKELKRRGKDIEGISEEQQVTFFKRVLLVADRGDLDARVRLPKPAVLIAPDNPHPRYVMVKRALEEWELKDFLRSPSTRRRLGMSTPWGDTDQEALPPIGRPPKVRDAASVADGTL